MSSARELGAALLEKIRQERMLSLSAGPFLKWAGSKRQQVDTISEVIDRMHPGVIEHYYEPFVGAGSIFFALARRQRFKYAILSDTNAELMSTYEVVRDDPDGLIRELVCLVKEYGFSEKSYYEIRAWEPRLAPTRAARMIYLNKCGYNGLFRVNKKGGFNVPWGKRKNPMVFTWEGIRSASAALQGVKLETGDYGAAMIIAQHHEGAFAYFDPPYVPVSESSDFTAYGKDGFTMADQERLATEFRELATSRSGGQGLLSNSHCKTTLKLYQGLVRKRVFAPRSINSKGDKRGDVSELLVESRLRTTKKRT